jgi:hypothetical protein
MLLPYHKRSRDLVRKPNRDDEFQAMCADVYRQVYGRNLKGQRYCIPTILERIRA